MNSVVKSLPNEQLKSERLRRGWSREYVAEQIGVADPKTVGRWERGYSFPSAYFLQRLCDLFGMFAEDLGLYQEPRSHKAVSTLSGQTPPTHAEKAPPTAIQFKQSRNRTRSFIHTAIVSKAQKGQETCGVSHNVMDGPQGALAGQDAQGFLTQWIKQQIELQRDLSVTMSAYGNNDERIARVLDVVADQDFFMQIHNGAMVIVMPLEQA